MRQYLLAACVWAVTCSGSLCWGISGSLLPFNSNNSNNGKSATLASTGYVGTYIGVADSGDGGSVVNLTINANRESGGAGVVPHMNIAVADSKFGFTLDSTTADNFSTGDFWLPAGTHFVRVERDTPNNPTSSSHIAAINSLDVSGAVFSNEDTTSNALAAADTYIDKFRKGSIDLTVLGAVNGTEVQIGLKRHAFNFGTNIHGTSNTGLLVNNPTPGSNAYNYQQFVTEHFNMAEGSNAGKWSTNEGNRDSVNMSWQDTIFTFAENNNMRSRLHAMLWGNQQPGWVTTMVNNPESTDTYTGGGSQGTNLSNADALYSDLLAPAGTPSAGEPSEIHERIAYYVGDGDGDINDGDRARRYIELDVYNESYHTGVNNPDSIWNLYKDEDNKPTGVAKIFEEVAATVAAAGADTKLYVNEYSSLQNQGGDSYANWYRQHTEEIQNADGDPSDGPVSGVGIQYYSNNGHNPSIIQRSLQNLAVLGLPMTLTEFGVSNSVTDDEDRIRIVTETHRMLFGTPDAEGLLYWGWWASATSPGLQGGGILVESDWDLTPLGVAWEALRDGWNTDETLLVGTDGAIHFDGFWGDYEITVGGETFDLTLLKGMTEYELTVGTPLLGDYNNDGVVDAADYTVWRDAMETGETTLFNRDPSRENGTDAVDEEDYAFWRANFGMSVGSGAGGAAFSQTAVPEPSTTAFALVACLIMCISRRRL